MLNVIGLANHTILRSKSGKEIPITDSAAPIKDGDETVGVVLVFSDVSDRKKAEADSAILASIVESSNDAIVSKDLNGIITSWNKGAERIFGYTAEDTIGKPVTMLMPEDRVNEEPGILERLRRGEKIDHYETVRRHKSGRLLDISLNVSPVFSSDGKIIGASKIARDMTDRKQAELAKRESEIMHRLVEAQESERHRIARDLHDHLGQKMTALRLRIEALSKDMAFEGEAGKKIADLQAAASSVDRDIGFLSWELRPTELELFGISDALRSFVREWSAQYGIAAEFHGGKLAADGEGGALSKSEETNLYRIVQEALTNVLKHAKAQNVSVLLQRRDRLLVLIIEDDGVGFDCEGLSTGNHRSGLGLIGMKERIALLGGELEIDSCSGNGATIIARIPVGEGRN